MEYRIEKDTMGEVKVPANKLWGAQTERSRNNFKIGPAASMPLEIVYGFAYLKKLRLTPTKKQEYFLQKKEILSLRFVRRFLKASTMINFHW